MFGVTVGPETLDEETAIVPIKTYRQVNDYVYAAGFGMGGPSSTFKYSFSDILNPSQNEIWSSLCADDQWRWKPAPAREELFFCAFENYDKSTDYWGENATMKAVPAPAGMHRGALAPKWVFETEATPFEEGAEKSLDAYMKRLICVVTGRFVVIERPDAYDSEKLESTNGKPMQGAKYRYRYWDNNGHVYDTTIAKCRQNMKWLMGGDTEKNVSWTELIEDGMLPGDFRLDTKMPLWMRHRPGETSEINDGEFWDTVYLWAHDGTTYCSEWDQRLVGLAKSAGVPCDILSRSWPLDESKLDIEAAKKG